jgi:FkbM family methyltransferase
MSAGVSRNSRADWRKRLKSMLPLAITTLMSKRSWMQTVRKHRSGFSEYELMVAPLLCDLRKISVDIGADHGSCSINICDCSLRCIAFEPRPAQAGMIREMVAATGLPIEVETVALSDQAGLARMRILTMDPGRSTIEGANILEDPDGSPRTEIRVPKLRLDDYELHEVGFIKIDVEGHEFAVLKGAAETIRTSMPNLLIEIEERHHANATREVSGFLTELGYEGFFILDGEVIPFARFDKSVHQDPANIGGWKENWQFRGVYVSNFFFLPAPGGDKLRAAVSSVRLKGRPSV